jgi:glycerol transport system substrate-binding protein
MDYGKKDPSLGWRYTDAWMSMAGMGDVGEPNGLPVDEWGIRVNENSQPVGSCVTRGGATNSPAASMPSKGDRVAARTTRRQPPPA